MIGAQYTTIEQGSEERPSLHPLHALVEAGASFDWITPTVALLGQLSGGLVQMAARLDCWGWTYATLRSGGVKIITAQPSPSLGMMLFTVSAKHARRAAHLLR